MTTTTKNQPTITERLQMMELLDDARRLCAQHGVTIEEAWTVSAKRSRSNPTKHARWALFMLLNERGWSSAAIGRAVGMHHTTVAQALRKMGANEKSPGLGHAGGAALPVSSGKGESNMIAAPEQEETARG